MHDGVDLRDVQVRIAARSDRPWCCRSSPRRARTARGWRRAAPSRCGSTAGVRTFLLRAHQAVLTRLLGSCNCLRTPLSADAAACARTCAAAGTARCPRHRAPAAAAAASAAAAAAGLPASRKTFPARAWRSARRWTRARRARRTRRRQSAGCRAARRTRTSRGRAGPVPSFPPRRVPPSSEITCAVPVLPATS